MAEETVVAAVAETAEPANAENGPRERRPRGGRRRGPTKDGNEAADKKVADPEKTADAGETAEKKKPRKRPPPKCKYFKATGVCKFGADCKFRHVYTPKEEDDAPVVDETVSTLSEPIQAPVVHMPLRQIRKIEAVRPQRQILKAEQIGSDEQKRARTAEITYFKRRFAGTVVTELDDGKTKIAFSYKVNDPEWPFDVRIVDFTLTINAEHPISKAVLDAEEGLMPSALHVFLVQQFNKIITEKHEADTAADTFEVIGKWLIRRIDINIFDVFVAGLKRAQLIQNAATCGIRVTVPKKADSKPEERALTTADEVAAALASVNGRGSNEENENGTSDSDGDEVADGSGSSNGQTKPKDASSKAASFVPSSAKLNLVANWTNEDQSIGTLTLVYLSGSTRCLRCGQQDFFEVAEGKTKQWPCKKCATAQSIRFESALAHASSNTIAHIYPVGCRPTDCVLQGSKLKAVCFNCTQDLLVEALPYAAPSKTWCRECNSKLCFTILSTSFQGNVSSIPLGDKLKLPKLKKPKENGFAIVVGTPLPAKGTCKHYSKSYRWFRFPCCGKLYPCDTCHDQTEDHDCDFANRMICGLCSTEQGYSKDKCKFCANNVTKVSTAHWEGGKGCRNQKAMSRNDPRKYKNTGAKTIPAKRTGKKSESSK
uniref:C3H1-type domain-containing protein n=1 Tax=Panagrellus redivivus TaxID=6233 RepID=A0A7E4W1Z6_PANRE